MRGSRVTESHRARIGRAKKRLRQSGSLVSPPASAGAAPLRFTASAGGRSDASSACYSHFRCADPASLMLIRPPHQSICPASWRKRHPRARANETNPTAGRARSGRAASRGHHQPADHRAGRHRRAAAPAAAGGHRDVGRARRRTCSAGLADQPVPDGGRARPHHRDRDDRRGPGHHPVRRDRRARRRRRTSRRRGARHHHSRDGPRHPGRGRAHRARCIGRARSGRGNRRDPHRHRAECRRRAAGRSDRARLCRRQGRRGGQPHRTRRHPGQRQGPHRGNQPLGHAPARVQLAGARQRSGLALRIADRRRRRQHDHAAVAAWPRAAGRRHRHSQSARRRLHLRQQAVGRQQHH